MRIYLHLIILGIVLIAPLRSTAQVPSLGFWKKHSPKLVYTTSSQSISTVSCSGAVTLQNQSWLNVPTNVGSNLTVSLSSTGSVIFYSDSSCTQSITSTAISSGTNSVTVYFASNSTGTIALIASASSYAPALQSETIVTNPYIWTGAGGNANWNTAGNWSGGAAPGAAHVAVFNSVCSSNCSPTINSNISIGGVRIESAYNGTITQSSGSTISLGAGGWTQLGGTFVGSSGGDSIFVNGPVVLSQGSFTSTSGTFTVLSDSWTLGSTTFNANSGTIEFMTYGYGNLKITTPPGPYHNLSFLGHGSTYDLSSSTLTVNGNLNFPSYGYNFGSLNSGTLNVSGNIVTRSSFSGSASLVLKGNVSGQTIDGGTGGQLPKTTVDIGANSLTLSGLITILGDFTVLSVGSATTTGSTLAFSTYSYSSSTITPGNISYNNVAFYGIGSTYNFGSATMTIAGNISFPLGGYNGGILNSGTLNIGGNILSESGFCGTGILVLTGNVSGQSVTATGGSIPNLSVNAPANNVTLSGPVAVCSSTVIVSGNVSIVNSSQSLSTQSLSLNGNTLTKNGGTLSVNSVTVGTGSLHGGTIAP